MTVSLAESVAIVALNLCAITVLTRNRNLRKQSMYLVINLAVIDMFIGVIAVYHLFYLPGVDCKLWKRQTEVGANNFMHVMMLVLFTASLTNIAIIALERVHALFFPFRHRVLKNCVYRLIIAIVWVTSGLGPIASELLLQTDNGYSIYLKYPFISICLLIICVSYTSIVIKVRRGAQRQHNGAASRERKLTMTLLIVTVVSLLCYLPFVIWRSVIDISNFKILLSLPPSVRFHLRYAFVILFYANSLANPILYTIRLPEYRSALVALFSKRPQQQRQVAVFPLRDMS